MEEISIVSWHFGNRGFAIEYFEKNIGRDSSNKTSQNFFKRNIENITSALFNFFFNRSEGEPHPYHFSYISFEAYLIARRLVKEIGHLHSKIYEKRHRADNDLAITDVLADWTALCGPTRMDGILFGYVCEEISLRSKGDVEKWQRTLSALFGHILDTGMPMDRLKFKTFKKETLWAASSEEALFAVLNGCALVTRKISEIKWPSETAFWEWLHGIRGNKARRRRSACLQMFELFGFEWVLDGGRWFLQNRFSRIKLK